MKRWLMILLIPLLIVAEASAASASKTLWDRVEVKANSYGLTPKIIFLEDDLPWTFKANEDYEKLIDVMMDLLMETKIKEDPAWYEQKEYWGIAGFIFGFLLAK